MDVRPDTGPVSVAASAVSIERPGVYVVATPIGNLADLSPRAASVLGAVDVVLCEDTRHSRTLLERYGIVSPTLALHEHNEKHISKRLVARLRERREACALVSDAGTPLVSDPGYVFVNCAIEAGMPVVPVPGPCALIAALSVSGLPAERFCFEGFLPATAHARALRLEALAEETRTLVFYEAPHRIVDAIEALIAAFGGERPGVLCRELTKRFESVYRGHLEQLHARLVAETDARRGEFVVVVGGRRESADELAAERILRVLLAETDRRAALRAAAKLTGLGRNRLYGIALRLGVDGDRGE